MSLGVPSAMVLSIEWWTYEIVILLSGYMGVNESCAQVIFMSLTVVGHQISRGHRTGLQVYVGQSVGSEDILTAKRYFKISSILTIITVLSTAILMNLFSL